MDLQAWDEYLDRQIAESKRIIPGSYTHKVAKTTAEIKEALAELSEYTISESSDSEDEDSLQQVAKLSEESKKGEEAPTEDEEEEHVLNPSPNMALKATKLTSKTSKPKKRSIQVVEKHAKKDQITEAPEPRSLKTMKKAIKRKMGANLGQFTREMEQEYSEIVDKAGMKEIIAEALREAAALIEEDSSSDEDILRSEYKRSKKQRTS